MTVYDQFVDSSSEEMSNPPRTHTPCNRRPSLDISSIISYEDGWDDHEGPIWNDPLDAESVAQQAGLKPRVVKASPRFSPQIMQKEKPQRSQSSNSVTSADSNTPCPPDIEEIDLYMPSVEHRWFRKSTPETDDEISVIGLSEASKSTECPNRRGSTKGGVGQKAQGCGYSCKISAARRSGLAKPHNPPSMVEVSQLGW